jgi:NAD(P)-dependent dehydrogenase (short-subunit alcohol dehydrogenase family)
MMARALAANGAAKVYIAARRMEPLQAAAKEIGPQVVPLVCDVTNKDSLMQAVQTVKAQAGHLNLLICNSGTTGVGDTLFQRPKPVSPDEFSTKHWEYSVEDYLHPFGVNVAGAWYTSVAFLPLLDKGNKEGNVSQSSQIIIISSTSGLSKRGEAGFAYAQSKAASIHLAKQLSTLLPQWGMRANCITPGCKYMMIERVLLTRLIILDVVFPSGMVEPKLKRFRRPDGTLGKLEKAFPLQRLGNEQDIGGTIVYLTSKAGAYTNGTIMVVDGAIMYNIPSVL